MFERKYMIINKYLFLWKRLRNSKNICINLLLLSGHHFNVKSFHRYMINNDLSDLETLIKFCQLDNTG